MANTEKIGKINIDMEEARETAYNRSQNRENLVTGLKEFLSNMPRKSIREDCSGDIGYLPSES